MRSPRQLIKPLNSEKECINYFIETKDLISYNKYLFDNNLIINQNEKLKSYLSFFKKFSKPVETYTTKLFNEDIYIEFKNEYYEGKIEGKVKIWAKSQKLRTYRLLIEYFIKFLQDFEKKI